MSWRLRRGRHVTRLVEQNANSSERGKVQGCMLEQRWYNVAGITSVHRHVQQRHDDACKPASKARPRTGGEQKVHALGGKKACCWCGPPRIPEETFSEGNQTASPLSSREIYSSSTVQPVPQQCGTSTGKQMAQCEPALSAKPPQPYRRTHVAA